MNLNNHPRNQVGLRAIAGFTMIEIALCLGIIGFALVAIIGILPIGMSVQKDNREETVINFDANYLMDSIRSGARGQDELTNYIVVITNIWTDFVVSGTPPNATTNLFSPNTTQVVYWYQKGTNGAGNYYAYGGNPYNTPILTNGANIIGLLSIPKYTLSPTAGATFRSNYLSADFRAITGSPLDQGTSSDSSDFAFIYRVFPELNPVTFADPSIVNDPSPMVAQWASLQQNLFDLRLSFRWPVLPGNQLGVGYKVYRTMASGRISSLGNLSFLTPQTYSVATSTNTIP